MSIRGNERLSSFLQQINTFNRSDLTEEQEFALNRLKARAHKRMLMGNKSLDVLAIEEFKRFNS